MKHMAFDVSLTFAGGARISICAEEAARAERLFRLAFALDQNHALLPDLYRLFEHAGILHCYWTTRPTNARVLRTVYEAWANECENVVLHFLHDGSLFLEDEGARPFKKFPDFDYYRPPAPVRAAPVIPSFLGAQSK